MVLRNLFGSRACWKMLLLLFRPFSNIDEDLEDIECDNPDLTVGLHGDLGDLKQEVLSAYQQVNDEE
jgi:hypothetical protein